MIRGHKIVVVFIVAAAAAAFWWLHGHPRGLTSGDLGAKLPSSAAMPAVEEVPAPVLTQAYANKDYNFSVQIPADFKASEIANDAGGKMILLQNSNGQGVQIYVTPSPDDTHALTADDVRTSIPDMRVESAQEVPVGSEYKGVAFRSDNEAFAGDSREVWFIFRSNLYQISTYSRFDPLLKAMFGTWQFK